MVVKAAPETVRVEVVAWVAAAAFEVGMVEAKEANLAAAAAVAAAAAGVRAP